MRSGDVPRVYGTLRAEPDRSKSIAPRWRRWIEGAEGPSCAPGAYSLRGARVSPTPGIGVFSASVRAGSNTTTIGIFSPEKIAIFFSNLA